MNTHFNIVALNPEKSKHLETATMKIGEFEIDFVNLRTETYSSESRIPLMQFGTPYEDAARRDLTINSLFYNINDRTLEDFTGSGINDLNCRLIRTPLPALVTLTDDPLRILRAVRFACRLGFSFADDLVEAARSPSVRESLVSKVSRERISQEVEQMMSEPSSARSLMFLHRLDLLSVVLLSSNQKEDMESLASLGHLAGNDFRLRGLNLHLTHHFVSKFVHTHTRDSTEDSIDLIGGNDNSTKMLK